MTGHDGVYPDWYRAGQNMWLTYHDGYWYQMESSQWAGIWTVRLSRRSAKDAKAKGELVVSTQHLTATTACDRQNEIRTGLDELLMEELL